jgi:hypothetical protein
VSAFVCEGGSLSSAAIARDSGKGDGFGPVGTKQKRDRSEDWSSRKIKLSPARPIGPTMSFKRRARVAKCALREMSASIEIK